jgi:hypothetical protein
MPCTLGEKGEGGGRDCRGRAVGERVCEGGGEEEGREGGMFAL